MDVLNHLPPHLQRLVLQKHTEKEANLHAKVNASVQTEQQATSKNSSYSCQNDFRLADVTIEDAKIPTQLVKEAYAEAQDLLLKHGTPAGTGSERTINTQVRGDVRLWLTPEIATSTSAIAQIASILTRQLPEKLRASGLLDGPGRVSMQVACYPGGGAHYARHADRSKSAPDRCMTAILYLNTRAPLQQPVCPASATATASNADASKTQQTQSQTQHDTSSSTVADILSTAAAAQGASQGPMSSQGPCLTLGPLGGRLVVFPSHWEHEVMPNWGPPRIAITAWYCETDQHGSGAKQPAVRQTAEGVGSRATNSRQQEPLRGPARGPAGPQQTALADEIEPDRSARADAATEVSHQSKAAAQLTRRTVDGGRTIFVSVPAYRDPEARWTIQDLFTKAANSDALRVGIVWQLDCVTEAHFMQLPTHLLSQVRQIVLDYREAEGPCKARALAGALYAGEAYVLQIDSHMRFAEGWDEQLISMLHSAEQQAEHGQAIISTYPPSYEGTGDVAVLDEDNTPTAIVATHWDADGMLRTKAVRLSACLDKPHRSLFWAAGFSFSRGKLLRQVPYLTEVPGLFFGEEMAMLLRYWQAGWDVFCPTRSVAFHLWSRKHRNTFQGDGVVPQKLKMASQQHVLALLTGKSPTGVGAVDGRDDTQQFYEHVGVDFAKRLISDWALRGALPEEMWAGDQL